ncbi:hypothetical protein TWF718_000281 [Orbilia javanica]|uniref:Uncharacterized protein n=1 Tax=Orbilia javanica TaxID=47235 RepID=A0AAN8RLV3_9PEZI
MTSPSSNKPLPPSSSFPSATPFSPKSLTPEIPFTTYPQPHFHRTWYRKCLHSKATVRVPSGAEAEYLPSEGKYVTVNKHRMCMCESVDGYYLEEVGCDVVEMEVVEEFWRILEGEKKRAGEKGGGVRRGILGVVRGVLGGKGRETGGEGRRVFRWVPRWRRLEGSCGRCVTAAEGWGG